MCQKDMSYRIYVTLPSLIGKNDFNLLGISLAEGGISLISALSNVIGRTTGWACQCDREVVMPAKKLKEFLDENGVKYVTITHSPAYTARQIADSAHIPAKELAKSVILMADNRAAMVVVPASQQVDLGRMREIFGSEAVSLADESQFKTLFPGCELGAMPPFGNLYGMGVHVSDKLSEDEEIAFNAGSHTELVRMAYSDFAGLVKPTVVEF